MIFKASYGFYLAEMKGGEFVKSAAHYAPIRGVGFCESTFRNSYFFSHANFPWGGAVEMVERLVIPTQIQDNGGTVRGRLGFSKFSKRLFIICERLVEDFNCMALVDPIVKPGEMFKMNARAIEVAPLNFKFELTNPYYHQLCQMKKSDPKFWT